MQFSVFVCLQIEVASYCMHKTGFVSGIALNLLCVAADISQLQIMRGINDTNSLLKIEPNDS